MTTATPTQRDTRPVGDPGRPKASRGVVWTQRPQPTRDGGEVGYFVLRIGTQYDHYRCTLEQRDDFAESWLVQKDEGGQFAAGGYLVCFPVNGSFGKPTCTCPGYGYHGHCRHTDGLGAALAKAHAESNPSAAA